LIEDAYAFSQDIMMGVNLMPFAAAFILLIGIASAWFQFFYLKSTDLFINGLSLIIISTLFYLSYFILKKSFQLKKKYSTLFNIKKELDKMKE